MEKSKAINMAVTVIMMDKFLDIKAKQEIIEALRELEDESEGNEVG